MNGSERPFFRGGVSDRLDFTTHKWVLSINPFSSSLFVVKKVEGRSGESPT